jgi:ribose transport system ATP-binding protein
VTTARVRVDGVEKSFGPTRALAGVTLTAEPGEVHALLGENGAGKSTLMQILAGALRADRGRMVLDGAEYSPSDPIEARSHGVAIVHQEPALCAHLSVGENILLGVEPTRFGLIDAGSAAERVARALDAIGGAQGGAPPARLLASSLSPAQQQLVAIARALGQKNCRLLILDEPTSRLSATEIERLFVVLARLRQDGMTILFVSHQLEEVQRIADRFTLLRDGATVVSGSVANVTTAELVRAMAGPRASVSAAKRTQRPAGEVVLALDSIAGRRLPVAASLELRRGEVLGIAGLVGSGRSELLRAVYGLERVKSGTIRVAAFVGPASPARRLAQGVGFASEDRKQEGLALALSIARNVTLSRLAPLGSFGLVTPARERAAAQRWIDRLRVRSVGPDQPTAELSGGNQQKVAIARLLHQDAEVLLLDEPTRGVDIASRAEIHALISELAERGKAVLVVSSQLSELLAIADRIAVMRRGRLGDARPVAELDEHVLLGEAIGA